MNLNEAKAILHRNGFRLVNEDYPGDDYKRPIFQMMKEIQECGKSLEPLRNKIIKDKFGDLEYYFNAESHGEFENIRNDGWGYAAWFNLDFAKDVNEAKKKARELFADVSNKSGLPITFSPSGGAKKRGIFWKDSFWCIDFNILTNDKGEVNIQSLSKVVAQDDKYWELLDDMYTHRKDKSSDYKENEDDYKVEEGKEKAKLIKTLNAITSSPMTAKDWERFNTSTIWRQYNALNKMGDEKAATRKHAILLMLADRYEDLDKSERIFNFRKEQLKLLDLDDIFRRLGLRFTHYKNWDKTRESRDEILKFIKNYLSDELEGLER